MKKKTLLGLSFAALLSITTVGAATSGIQTNLKFKLDQWISGETFELKSAYTTASPENSGVYFTECGSLEMGYANNSYRDFPIYLYDDDGWGAADDKLKRYEGYFSGRSLLYVQYEALMDSSGNIDGTGDDVAELYIEGRLGKLPGDVELTGGTDLFYYEIILH